MKPIVSFALFSSTQDTISVKLSIFHQFDQQESETGNVLVFSVVFDEVVPVYEIARDFEISRNFIVGV